MTRKAADFRVSRGACAIIYFLKSVRISFCSVAPRMVDGGWGGGRYARVKDMLLQHEKIRQARRPFKPPNEDELKKNFEEGKEDPDQQRGGQPSTKRP